jgi:glycine cleavage system H protein
MRTVPEERKFSADHVWITMEDEFIGRCGISDRRQDTLGDIVFVHLPEADIEVKAGEKVVLIESVRDLFTVQSPVSGLITDINKLLYGNPGIINTDPYGDGWIYKIDVKEPSEFHDLMNDDEYHDFIQFGGDI